MSTALSGVAHQPRVTAYVPGDGTARRGEAERPTTRPPLQVRAAVRRLIDLAAADPEHAAADSDDGTVLHLELDGYRCVLTRLPTPIGGTAAVPAGLSPREREVARMVCSGLTNRAIATVLDISPWTVGTHLRRIFMKLEVSSRAAMVARFLNERP